jgi:hypothetical protein
MLLMKLSLPLFLALIALSFKCVAQNTSTFEFNSASDLSTNSYNDGDQSYGSEILPRYESTVEETIKS